MPHTSISATQFVSFIIKGLQPDGLPDTEELISSEQRIAWLNFGDKFGVLDFTNDQYRSFIRQQRILVRGERGELTNDNVTYLQDVRAPIHLAFVRHETGIKGNLEGNHLIGIQIGEEWIYHNPLSPAVLPEEDIAIGHCLLNMAEYVEGAEPFYSLAEACQDRYLMMMIAQSIESRQPVSTSSQLWSTG